MPEQQPNSMEENKAEKQPIDKSRRRFAKAGAASPIIMTLASQPAFGWGGGMQCMSNMMSGNLSDPNRGNCDLGWSPGAWCHHVGQINSMDTIWAWQSAGFDYGDFFRDTTPPSPKPGSCSGGHKRNKAECYVGGSTLSDIPGLVGVSGYDGSTTLREIVCNGQGTDARHCVTAYLNASLPGINYILTTQQVIGLCNGTIPVPPGYSSLRGFLDSTWQ